MTQKFTERQAQSFVDLMNALLAMIRNSASQDGATCDAMRAYDKAEKTLNKRGWVLK